MESLEIIWRLIYDMSSEYRELSGLLGSRSSHALHARASYYKNQWATCVESGASEQRGGPLMHLEKWSLLKVACDQRINSREMVYVLVLVLRYVGLMDDDCSWSYFTPHPHPRQSHPILLL